MGHADNTIEPILADNENLLSLLPFPVAVLSGESHTISFANDAMFSSWKRKREDKVIGYPLLTALPDTPQVFIQELREVFQQGKIYAAQGVEVKQKDRDGLLYSIYIDYMYQPLRDRMGNITGVFVTAQDVTEKVMATKELTDSARKLEKTNEKLTFRNNECMMAIDTAKLGTWKLATDTSEFVFSERGAELHGLNTKCLSFGTGLNMVSKDYRELVKNTFREAIVNGGTFEIEYPIRPLDRDGVIWLRSSGRCTKSEKDGCVVLNGTLMDITKEKLEVTRKNEFIGMISHELKTPLTSLSGMIQMIKKKLDLEKDSIFHEINIKAIQQIKKMTSMINSFVNISRLESGKFELQYTEFNMQELVEEYLAEVRIISSSYNFVQHNCHLAHLKADRNKIGAVLANMLSNAIKFSPQHSTIEVSCIPCEDYLEVTVKDQGSGISAPDQHKIFERFSYIENRKVQHAAGFGIGLYLSAEIIKHHHGEIWVENNSDKGCTFHFKLPLALPDQTTSKIKP